MGQPNIWGYQRDSFGRLFFRVVLNTNDADKMPVRSYYYEKLTRTLVENGVTLPVYDSRRPG
ncbi:hypothetical protein [Aerococcus sp. 1KP-2016]|nr:hypothetical protein [Aerococcus sp. 1KP-2016]